MAIFVSGDELPHRLHVAGCRTDLHGNQKSVHLGRIHTEHPLTEPVPVNLPSAMKRRTVSSFTARRSARSAMVTSFVGVLAISIILSTGTFTVDGTRSSDLSPSQSDVVLCALMLGGSGRTRYLAESVNPATRQTLPEYTHVHSPPLLPDHLRQLLCQLGVATVRILPGHHES